jgi:HSP20 family molecular chaperone IbpA
MNRFRSWTKRARQSPTVSSGAEKMAERATLATPVDIYENPDEILILADVPGVAADGFSIKLDRDQLTIDARRTLVPSGEQPFDYQRVFVVPNGIDADKIAATLQNGVLRLVLPKPAALKPRQIEVKAG